MGGAYSSQKREEKYVQNFGPETPKERDHVGDLGVDGRIILRWISKWEGVN
jgi:hypothetical protein